MWTRDPTPTCRVSCRQQAGAWASRHQDTAAGTHAVPEACSSRLHLGEPSAVNCHRLDSIAVSLMHSLRLGLRGKDDPLKKILLFSFFQFDFLVWRGCAGSRGKGCVTHCLSGAHSLQLASLQNAHGRICGPVASCFCHERTFSWKANTNSLRLAKNLRKNLRCSKTSAATSVP